MQVTINGKPETLDDGISVAQLLVRLALEPVRVAVEINEDLVSRKTFTDMLVHDGDRIEIVTFVGGG